jgi:phosphatidate phosphatase APP1
MSDWQEILAPYIRAIEKRYDKLKYRLYYALGGPGPLKIVPYRGFGTEEALYLKGRVLEDRGVTEATTEDSLWQNLLNTYKRLSSREVPHARLRAQLGSLPEVAAEVEADEEGMFEVWLHPEAPLPSDRLWHPIDLELRTPQSDAQDDPVRATGEVLVPPPSAEYGVISDIDDTVLQTDAASLLRMARTVFFENAHTRLPFPGAAAFYRALHAGAQGEAQNPLFYVSNSMWNLYDLLTQFFHLHEIPVGPLLFLRNWGIYEDELLPLDHEKHKLPIVRQILELYEELPFILIGDSGESDPEIYQQIAEEYPDRILAIYIRNVSPDLERPQAIHALAEEIVAAGSTLVLAEDSLAMAQHAAREGWIASEALSAIAAAKEKDEGPPTEFEQLLSAVAAAEGEEEAEAPTVVVHGDEETVS